MYNKKYIIEDVGISFSELHPDSTWNPEYDIFLRTYNNLITEWSKNLYTPYEFLKDIIKNIYNTYSAIILQYSLNDILSISTINWKYYKQFKQDTENTNKLNIYILYYKNPWNLVEQKLIELKFNKATINKIQSNLNLKAFCLTADSINNGCLVVINGEQVESMNTEELEQLLDHELNHYFSKVDNQIIESIKLNDRIKKIGSDAGYDLSNPIKQKDFINHILDNSEFNSMIADVCNILEFKLNVEDKYNWLIDHSTSKFLQSAEYKNLNPDLQNILLFTTICRVYSSKRWNILKTNLKIQFDKKESFTEKTKSGLMTFIERLKKYI